MTGLSALHVPMPQAATLACSLDEQVDDLLRFAQSPQFLDLRHALGLAVN